MVTQSCEYDDVNGHIVTRKIVVNEGQGVNPYIENSPSIHHPHKFNDQEVRNVFEQKFIPPLEDHNNNKLLKGLRASSLEPFKELFLEHDDKLELYIHYSKLKVPKVMM